MKKFTVITICLNMEQEIVYTIESVLHQSCTDFEYIIKDGLSKDNTVSIAQSFVPAFAEKGISFRVLSKKDSGIYDAMNQATLEAQGEWVIYMNAGDRFAYDSVLEQVKSSGHLEEADVLYGDTILRNNDLYYYNKPFSLEKFNRGLPFCHQSTFTRTELLVKAPYSLKYRICSAFHCYFRLYREGRRFVYLPIAMSVFDTHGVSSNWRPNYQDKLAILEDLPQRDEEAIQRIKSIIRKKEQQEWLHRHFFRFIPKKLRLVRRRRMYIRQGWKTAEEMFGSGKAES